MSRIKAPPVMDKYLKVDIVAMFDDIMKKNEILTAGVEEDFLKYIDRCDLWKKRFHHAAADCQRLEIEITSIESKHQQSEAKLTQARTLIETERRNRLKLNKEHELLEKQVETIKHLLLTDPNRANTLDNETKERLRDIKFRTSSLNVNCVGEHDDTALDAMESTESILYASDLSYDESCHPSDSRTRSGRSFKRASADDNFILANISSSSCGDGVKRKSVNLQKPRRSRSSGTINAPSDGFPVIKKRQVDTSSPQKSDYKGIMTNKKRQKFDERRVTYSDDVVSHQDFEPTAPPDLGTKEEVLAGVTVKRTLSNASGSAAIITSRPHVFVSKSNYGRGPNTGCQSCKNKIGFGETYLKCGNCRIVTHERCQDSVPLPCIPKGLRTPVDKQNRLLENFTTDLIPMVPAIIIQCVTELESKGLDQIGLYRVPGPKNEVSELMKKFERCRKGAVDLTSYDKTTIASCLKSFLISLKEPIIQPSLRQRFVDATEMHGKAFYDDAQLKKVIAELSLPNRDTLAFLMIHLQNVAASRQTAMTCESLATIFGPTLVGLVSKEHVNAYVEANIAKRVVRALLDIDQDFWASYALVEQTSVLFSTASKPPSSKVSSHLSWNKFASPFSHNAMPAPSVLSDINGRTPLRNRGPSERRTRYSKKSTTANSVTSGKPPVMFFQSPNLIQ